MLHLRSSDSLLSSSCKISQVPHGDAVNMWKVGAIFTSQHVVAFWFVTSFGCKLIDSDPYRLLDQVDKTALHRLIYVDDVLGIAVDLVLICLHLYRLL